MRGNRRPSHIHPITLPAAMVTAPAIAARIKRLKEMPSRSPRARSFVRLKQEKSTPTSLGLP